MNDLHNLHMQILMGRARDNEDLLASCPLHQFVRDEDRAQCAFCGGTVTPHSALFYEQGLIHAEAGKSDQVLVAGGLVSDPARGPKLYAS